MTSPHALLLVTALDAFSQAAPRGRGALEGWTGTITSVRRGDKTERLEGGDTVHAVCVETVTFTFMGDGTARFTVTHNETMTLSGKGGSATTREFGSDSGWVNAGVYHDDPMPAAAQRLLGMKSRWHFGVGNSDQKLRVITPSAPGFGKLMPNHNTREFLAGVELYSDDPPTVKTLSGGRTRQPGDDLGAITFGHLWPQPMTEQLSWNLTLGAMEPRVTIRGPECGCLDPENPDSTPLKFMAATTRSGGAFSEFTVKPEGKMPEITTNEGGAQAALELVGSKETGAVTLTIHYTKDGVRYDAKPLRVEFCTVEAITLEDDEHDLAFDKSGRLTVGAKSKAWLNGKESPNDLEWDLDQMGAPTQKKFDPTNRRGHEMKLIYDGLPEKNSDFGETQLTAKVSRGPCLCQQDESIRAFFTGDATNHPGGDGTPNWFYYWKQTAAAPTFARSMLEFERVVTMTNDPTATPIAKYDHATEKIILGGKLFEPNACRGEVDRATHQPTGRQDQGIDCFGNTLRHELQHRQDAIDWWGSARGPDANLGGGVWTDTDGDFLPLPRDGVNGCRPWSQKSCDDRPFDDVIDGEINAYWQGWTWPTGSVDREDWVCGDLGKQWQGSKCPQ